MPVVRRETRRTEQRTCAYCTWTDFEGTHSSRGSTPLPHRSVTKTRRHAHIRQNILASYCSSSINDLAFFWSLLWKYVNGSQGVMLTSFIRKLVCTAVGVDLLFETGNPVSLQLLPRPNMHWRGLAHNGKTSRRNGMQPCNDKATPRPVSSYVVEPVRDQTVDIL